MCLHECLEQFNLFGFHATRDRLRAMVAASGEGWTEPQLLRAVDALADARKSWVTHLNSAMGQRRDEKPLADSPERRVDWQWHAEWLEAYLTREMAARWLVAGLGECPECSHPLIHHGSWACAACSASNTVPWEARCRADLPTAAPGTSR
jgi:hypothetical protein